MPILSPEELKSFMVEGQGPAVSSPDASSRARYSAGFDPAEKSAQAS